MNKKMVMIGRPKKVKVELTSDEIELIRNELESASYNIYTFFSFDKIIEKLNKALGDKRKNG